MRRSPTRRLYAAMLLAVSVLAPMAVAPAPAVHAAGLDQHGRAGQAGQHGPDRRSGPHGEDDCPPGGLGPELTAELDRTIEDVRKQAGIPGVVVGLWMPGKGSYVHAGGVADTATREPMSADTRIRIGSETKTFTVTALLELVDDKLVGLDDPISAYVPGVRDGDRITLRQLAGMRSGLFPYTADADFVHDLLSDPYRSFTPRGVLAYGMKHKNTFKPDAEFQYSNSNLVLLGLVIEKVTGQTLRQVIHERVLRPAHLHNTLFPTGAEFPEPHAHGYTDQTLSSETEDATDWNPSWAWAMRRDDLRSARPAPLGEGRRHRGAAEPRDPGAAAQDPADRVPGAQLRSGHLRDRRVDRAQRFPAGVRDRDRLPALAEGHPGHHDQHGFPERGPGAVHPARPRGHADRHPGQRLRRQRLPGADHSDHFLKR